MSAFAFIQEGGSSCELYVSAWPSAEEAEEARIDCARGAYRTTPVFEVPTALQALGELFYETLETALRSLADLDTVDVPEGEMEGD